MVGVESMTNAPYLLPKARDVYKRQLLVSLELEDGFGQRTRLDFQKLERNPALDPALLKFAPPSGVDVVGDAS